MFCPGCGHENLAKADFCGECGAKLKKVATDDGATATVARNAGSAVVSPGMKWGITAASVFIPLIGIVMGIIYMRDENLEKKAVGKLWLWVGIGMAILLTIYKFGGGDY